MKVFEYIYSLKKYILLAFVLFISGIIFGYFIHGYFPEETNSLIHSLIDKYSPFFEESQINQFWFIFFSNAMTMFFVSVGGLAFGLFPLVSLFVNGLAMGIIADFSREFISWGKFFMAIAPHGALEIPALILGGAVGFKLTIILFKKIFKKPSDLKREVALAFQFYYKILMPLLLLAALIEVFVTARIIS